MNFFTRIKGGLTKTRENVFGKITNLLKSKVKIDDDLYDELEEILVSGDVGVSTSMDLIENLRDRINKERIKDPEQIYPLLEDEIGKFLTDPEPLKEAKPEIIVIVGVNGTGKTTSIGKFAWFLKNRGKSVLLGAADTFRAAAIEQLESWAGKTGAELVKHQSGADPAAVAYDAASAAKARGTDCVIIDTAGRLHTKVNLMGELEKISRTLKKIDPDAPHETLLVLDATTGQNAIAQAKEFSKIVPVTGIILTKLDGTAKGGVTIGISHELGIPIKYLGTGEGIEDFEPFDKAAFIRGLFD
jgi:fused signal recognition particle receptor